MVWSSVAVLVAVMVGLKWCEMKWMIVFGTEGLEMCVMQHQQGCFLRHTVANKGPCRGHCFPLKYDNLKSLRQLRRLG